MVRVKRLLLVEAPREVVNWIERKGWLIADLSDTWLLDEAIVEASRREEEELDPQEFFEMLRG